MTAGIYIIECLANNKCYVGSSSECERRMKVHMKMLRSGTHHNPHLQHAFSLYGENAFSWTMQACQAESRVSVEYALIEKLMKDGIAVFNAIRSPNGEVLEYSKTSRAKMSRSGSRNWKNNREAILKTLHSPQANAKRSAAHKGRKSGLPRSHFVNAALRAWEIHREKLTEQASAISHRNWENAEYRQKMSDARKAMWQTQSHREKVHATKIANATYVKHAKRVSDLWKDPEYRRKNLEARKASGAYAKATETRRKKKALRLISSQADGNQ